MSHRYSKHFPLFIYLNDLTLLNLSLLIVSVFYLGSGFWQNPNVHLLFAASNSSWILVSYFVRNFNIDRPLVLSDNINKYLMTLIYHVALLFGFLYVSGNFDVSRFVLLSHLAIFFVLIIVQRSIVFFFLDYIRKKGYNHRKVLIIGDKVIANRLKQSFNRHPEYGYDICGYLSKHGVANYSATQLVDVLKRRNIDEIYIQDTSIINRLPEITSYLKGRKISMKIVSDLEIDMAKADLEAYSDFPVFRLLPERVDSFKIRILKRGFDLGFSSTVMVCGAPIYMLIIAVTKLSSRGPVFYKQQRIGRNGKPFNIYKFRSMYINAEKFGPQLSKDNDPRITKWGKVMRKTRLDELPQFYNVLLGDMSVVGPRPERQHFIEQIIERAPQYSSLLSIKPGITSIGQVKYGYAENVEQMVERMSHDLVYLGKLRLRTDVGVIIDTVRVMVAGKGK